MEKSIDRHLEDVMGSPGVVGVVCTDVQGLCVGACGCGTKIRPGQMSGIVDQAKDLHPDVKEEPVIIVESDAGSVLIKSQDGVTFGICKTPS